MRKYAFTLIELLAVIIILAVILVIAVPQILGVIERTKTNAYELNIELMKRATETYVESGKKEIVGTSAVITLDELVENGFISPIKDPTDKSTECIGYVVVETVDGETTYTPCLKCGENYESDNYDPVLAGEEAPVPENANIHVATVPDGYVGIYTMEDLNNMRNNLSGKYILMNNLDFNSDSSYANVSNKTTYTTGTGWIPIGNSATRFTGTFNGNNYIIKSLYINRPTTDYTGLFGYVSGNMALIEKIGLEAVNVTGRTYVGGLVGQGYSAIFQNIYATGTVIGMGTEIGGIVGRTTGISTAKDKIENCYSTVNVTGTNIVGGIVGYPFDTDIINSFGAGNMTATTGSIAGALIGSASGGGTVITNSYRSNSSQIQMASGTPNTGGILEELMVIQSELFINYMLRWNVENVWDLSTTGFPKLGGTTIETNAVVSNQIRTIEDLYMMRHNLTGNYTLMNDLDFNNNSSYRNPANKTILTSSAGWLPVGNSATRFTGTFNGNNHIIKNLYINRPTRDYTGLFSYIDTKTAIVEKLGLESLNVTGKKYVGGLTGYGDYAIFQNIYATGTVTGTDSDIGGIIGDISGNSTDKAKIENCYSIVNVTGTTVVGGVVGYPYNTNIINSFGAGDMTTTLGASAGALVGATSGAGAVITNSYRSNSSQFQMASGTPNTGGTLVELIELQSELFINYMLRWNVESIWNVSTTGFPKLGGTNGITNAVVSNQIRTIEDLYMMRHNLTGNYTLMNDLDFNTNSSYRNPANKTVLTSNVGWLPVGNSTTKFTGTFNGNNHIIKNLYINRPTRDYTGLFSYIDTKTAIVEKLGLENLNVTGKKYVGGLTGYGNYAIFQNIYATGTVTGTDSDIGGIIGRTTGNSTDKAKIENCYSIVNVTGTTIVGGVVGYPFDTNIINSFGAGNMTTTTSGAGALVGATNGAGAVITNSYRSNSSQIQMASGTPNTGGTLAMVAELQTLSRTGLTSWDTTTIWQVNAGAYPTFR